MNDIILTASYSRGDFGYYPMIFVNGRPDLRTCCYTAYTRKQSTSQAALRIAVQCSEWVLNELRIKYPGLNIEWRTEL